MHTCAFIDNGKVQSLAVFDETPDGWQPASHPKIKPLVQAYLKEKEDEEANSNASADPAD